ncbi:MAG: hypothetical protein Q8K75_01320 [Chlamydiales bacterium]|nr:hypothetical protein [Chlamydiales bacterium]
MYLTNVCSGFVYSHSDEILPLLASESMANMSSYLPSIISAPLIAGTAMVLSGYVLLLSKRLFINRAEKQITTKIINTFQEIINKKAKITSDDLVIICRLLRDNFHLLRRSNVDSNKIYSLLEEDIVPKICSENLEYKKEVLVLINRLVCRHNYKSEYESCPLEIKCLIIDYLNCEDSFNLIMSLSGTDINLTSCLLIKCIDQGKIPLSLAVKFPDFYKNIAPYIKYVNCGNLSYKLEKFTNAETLVLSDTFNKKIPQAVLSNLRSLVMGAKYNQAFPEGLNLGNLQTLTMGHTYNQAFPKGLNLGNLQTLTMGYSYDQAFPEGLNLGNLQTLTMGHIYNQVFPEGLNLGNLQTLKMGVWYNQSFPEGLNLGSLQTLKMGLYNQAFPESLNLGNLRTLKMGSDYNQALPESLNLQNLQTLIVGRGYNQALPYGLRNLIGSTSTHTQPLPEGLDLQA